MLGREDDAYYATCLIVIEHPGSVVPSDADDVADGEADEDAAAILEPGASPEPEAGEEEIEIAPAFNVDPAIEELPAVRVPMEKVPDILDPGRFLSIMVSRVLDVTPVNMHRKARELRNSAMIAPLSKI